MKCEICKNEFTSGVQCGGCGKHFDFVCANITEPRWKRLGAERRSAWKCLACKEPSPVKEVVTLESLMKEIQEMKVQLSSMPKLSEDIKCIKNEIQDLKSSCQFISEKMDEFNDRITNAEKTINVMENKLVTLESEVKQLRKYTSNAEQRSRLNNIEIKGIPQEKNENLFKILDKISIKIGYEITKSQINYVSRIPSHNPKEKPIILSFLNRYIKEDFVAAARTHKILKAEDIGYQNSSQRIYVNDHLSADTKLLLNKTKEAAKQNNFSYVWVKYGKIHVRKNDSSRTFIINQTEDLNRIA